MDAEEIQQHTALAHAVGNPFGKGRRGRLGGRVQNHLGPEEQARPAHIPDAMMPPRQIEQPRARVVTDHAGILHQPLLLHHLERGPRGGTGHRVAREGVEIAKRAAKRIHRIMRGDHRRHRMPVRHRLADGDDVGGKADLAETPEIRAKTPETGLHLIRDDHATRAAHHLDRRIKPAMGQVGKALVGEEGAEDQRGKPVRGRLKRVDLFLHLRRKGMGMGHSRNPAQGAIAVRRGHEGHVGGIAPRWRVCPAELMHGRRVAVIGVIGGDHACLAGQGLRHPQGDVIRLGPGAGHERGIERRAHRRGQRLDIVQNPLVQIPRMGVQRPGLRADRLDHTRMAMADMRHVIVAIQVFAPLGIPQLCAKAAHQMHWFIIEGRHVRPQQAGAAVCQGFGHSWIHAVLRS